MISASAAVGSRSWRGGTLVTTLNPQGLVWQLVTRLADGERGRRCLFAGDKAEVPVALVAAVVDGTRCVDPGRRVPAERCGTPVSYTHLTLPTNREV